MTKSKMNLQQFADRYGLEIMVFTVEGPHGELHQDGLGQWVYFRRGIGYRKFNPVTQAKQAIEAIGLQYTPPPKPIKKDRQAFLIVKRSDGWYVADKAGPFKTRELARLARVTLQNNQQEPTKTS